MLGTRDCCETAVTGFKRAQSGYLQFKNTMPVYTAVYSKTFTVKTYERQ